MPAHKDDYSSLWNDERQGLDVDEIDEQAAHEVVDIGFIDGPDTGAIPEEVLEHKIREEEKLLRSDAICPRWFSSLLIVGVYYIVGVVYYCSSDTAWSPQVSAYFISISITSVGKKVGGVHSTIGFHNFLSVCQQAMATLYRRRRLISSSPFFTSSPDSSVCTRLYREQSKTL